jgi:hypothetical protein
MILSKFTTSGQLTYRFKECLLNAVSTEELKFLIQGDATAIANFYNLKLSGEKLYQALFLGLKDFRVFKFAKGCLNEEFDMSRYETWKEFRKLHPSVSVGEEFWRIKFGNNWEYHANKCSEKRKENSPFKISHWVEKHGFTVKEAEDRIAKIKKNCSGTLEVWVEKFGEEEGKRRHKHQHRFHLNYDESWGGDLEAKSKYTRETNRCTVDHWIKKGFTLEEAKIKVSETQKKYSGLHRDFWEAKGLSKTEVDNIFSILNSKKDGTSLKFFVETYGTIDGPEKYLMNCLLKSSCYREHGELAETLYPGFVGYAAKVNRLTEQAVKSMPECPGTRGRHIGNYHVDHKFSKISGYKENIPAEIIGHIKNLQWLKAEENTSKRGDCSISIESLMKDINENN